MTNLTDVIDQDELDAAVLAGHVKRQVHPREPYAILNYSDKCQYERGWNRTTLACRGLVYNFTDGRLVARSWPKFFNYGEPEAATLDLSAPAVVTDKIDGSLGILYRTMCWAAEWAVATRGSFTSDQALHATAILRTRYSDFVPPDGWTVLVEIVYPENRIVCDYGDTDDLVLLGAVRTATGETVGPEDVLGWTGPKAPTFAASTLAEALALPPRPGAEGVVVRCGEHAVKLKQEDYVALHRIVTGLNARVVWEHIGSGGTAASLCESLPDEFHGWVAQTAADLIGVRDAITNDARAEHARILAGLDGCAARKEYAAVAARSPNRAWLFMLLDGKDPEPKVWQTLRPSGEDRPFSRTDEAA